MATVFCFSVFHKGSISDDIGASFKGETYGSEGLMFWIPAGKTGETEYRTKIQHPTDWTADRQDRQRDVFVFRIIQRISGTGFSVPAESRFLLCDGRKEEKTGDAFFRTAYNARCTSPGAVTAVIDTLKIHNYNKHDVWR